MPKQILIVLAFCGLLVSRTFAQDLSKPVTYRTVAVPLRQALEQISQQAGVKLTVSEELGSEPIILSLRGATTQAAMDHIASAIGAKWTDKGKGEYLLERTPAMAEKLEQEALDLRTAFVKKSMARLSAELDTGQQSPEEFESAVGESFAAQVKLSEQNRHDGRAMNALISKFPGHRAMVRLLQLLRPEDIGSLREGESVAFSSHPNAMQRALPTGADQVAATFQAEHNAFAAEFQKEHPKPLDFFGGRYTQTIAPLAIAPSKLLLVISRRQFLFAEFVAVGDSGLAVDSGDDAIRPESVSTMETTSAAVLSAEAKAPDIPLSAASKAVAIACKQAEDKIGNPPPLTGLARELLLNPVAHDPMSFLVSDGFFAMADDTKTNLVAYPIDDLVDADFSLGNNGAFKLPDFHDQLKYFDEDVTIENGWTTAWPQDRIEALDSRTDRALYEECLHEADKKGFISIPAAAGLAASEKSSADLMVPESMGLLNKKYNPFGPTDPNLLRFYASLSTGQVAYLRGGSKLTAGELSQEQWNLFRTIAFGSRLRLEVTGGGKVKDDDLGDYFLNNEATEFMPDGLPGDASIGMTEKDSDLLFADRAQPGSGWEYAGEINLEEVARTIANNGTKPGSDWKIIWLAPGSSHDLTFTFSLTPTHKRVGSLREVVCGDERWTLDNLPADLKKKVDAAVVQTKAEMDKTPDTTPQPVAQPPQ